MLRDSDREVLNWEGSSGIWGWRREGRPGLKNKNSKNSVTGILALILDRKDAWAWSTEKEGRGKIMSEKQAGVPLARAWNLDFILIEMENNCRI